MSDEPLSAGSLPLQQPDELRDRLEAHRWQLEISQTEALPLNDAAVRQRSLDRARLEYEVGAYQLGVGTKGASRGVLGTVISPR